MVRRKERPDGTEFEVLIAGAGPTGLALACGLLASGLLASGVAVRVVDKAVEPAGTSRVGLQPRGSRWWSASSVLDINGRQAASVRVGQRTALVTRPWLVISQAEVEVSLRRRVVELGGTSKWGREVVAAEQDPHGVLVTTRAAR